jgi:small subunit ribosomal protein S4
MARYLGSRCKLCRRVGGKLFLKGTKCYSNCPLAKKTRQKLPGQHGGARQSKLSIYGLRFLEKQKARYLSGINERQFRRLFRQAEKMKGMTGENFLRFLELRLDNVVYRLGFGASKAQARQLVLHGHIAVNGLKVTIPSFILRAGDYIELRTKVQDNIFVKQALEEAGKRPLPSWLQYEPESFKGKVISLPERSETSYPVNEQLIVELYSR